ncbi:hypothetical protein C8A00DRAFT_18035 [Chaetomidium leptoderma]|uniref:Uncharacterized protein n=1 Tax=Chaetomidium leptoderma TaxID=669021 RepID=A0AAN6ZVJ8_9PEZI|nr:hypothetical protein C8A00DRAFT_18035 [Chaetomidium leptoderma]
MSNIIQAVKDAVNPKRREHATAETYDAQTRGPYADGSPAGQSKASPPGEARNPGRAEQSDLSSTPAGRRSGSVTSQTMNTAEEPNRSPKLGDSAGYGGMIKPVHKEGGKYGLS